MPIVTLPDHQLSKSAARRTKFWIKQLTGVDTSKQDGYAFLGTFHEFEETVEVPENTLFMSYIEDTRASGRVDGRHVTLWIVKDGRLEVEWTTYIDTPRGWALKIRDKVAEHYNQIHPLAALVAPADYEEMRAFVDRVTAGITDVRKGMIAVRDQVGEVPGVSGETRRYLSQVIEAMDRTLGMLGEG